MNLQSNYLHVSVSYLSQVRKDSTLFLDKLPGQFDKADLLKAQYENSNAAPPNYPRPYRLTFGQHKGETLDQVRPSYRDWLIRDAVYKDHEDLKAALIEGGYLSPTPTPPSSQSTTTIASFHSSPTTPPSSFPSTPTRQRNLSNRTLPTSPSSFRARKAAISQEAQRNDTMLNYDGSAYILDFGKHSGQRLSQVPPDYIAYLIESGAHKNHPDLAAALAEEGLL
ncbi:MAG: hypothetical protein Q9167_003466 [Letrouitia subvulpina]